MTGCDTRRAGVLFAQPTQPTPQCVRCLPNYYKTPFVRKNEGGDLIRCDNATALEESCAADSTQCFDQCCLSCKKGMICDNPATNTLTAVTVAKDFWRLSIYSDTFIAASHQLHSMKSFGLLSTSVLIILNNTGSTSASTLARA